MHFACQFKMCLISLKNSLGALFEIAICNFLSIELPYIVNFNSSLTLKFDVASQPVLNERDHVTHYQQIAAADSNSFRIWEEAQSQHYYCCQCSVSPKTTFNNDSHRYFCSWRAPPLPAERNHDMTSAMGVDAILDLSCMPG
jgi:hypothetical protein